MKSFKSWHLLTYLYDSRQLGAGGFGKVYLIRHKENGRKYAAKYQKLNSAKMQRLVGPLDHQKAGLLTSLP